jgi:hypothetical protein
MIGKGFGKRFEAPSYEEGVGVDGRFAAFGCIKKERVENGSLQPWLH